MKKSWLYLFKNAPNTMDAYDFFKISKIQSDYLQSQEPDSRAFKSTFSSSQVSK